MQWLSGQWKIRDRVTTIKVLKPDVYQALVRNNPDTYEGVVCHELGHDTAISWFLADVLREAGWKLSDMTIKPYHVPSHPITWYYNSLRLMVMHDCIEVLPPGPMIVYSQDDNTLYRFIVYRGTLVLQEADIDEIWPRNALIDGID